MNRLLGKLTYANVISTLALVLAIGGTAAFAASGSGPSKPAKLKLCAAKNGGALRLASGRRACRANERLLVIDRRGQRGAVGPTGAQGERGPAGASTSLTSPDGRFVVAATNDGIVLSGPGGSLAFDGAALVANGDLAISASKKLALTGGTLDVTAKTASSFIAGSNFTQVVGGAYQQTIGGGISQAIGGNLTQSVGIGLTQTVGGAIKVSGSTLSLGGSSCSLGAARVGSNVVSSAVTATGSSSKVFVC